MALDNTVFGKCPRSSCRGTGLLPYGRSSNYDYCSSSSSSSSRSSSSRRDGHVNKSDSNSNPSSNRESACHRYCPSCGEVWVGWDSKTDGCAWGPSWCHLFLLAFGKQVYARELEEAAAAKAEAAAAAASRGRHSHNPTLAPNLIVPQSQLQSQSQSQLRSSPRVETATSSADLSSSPASRPIPSVFGFRVHPATAFGRPWNEPPTSWASTSTLSSSSASMRGGGFSHSVIARKTRNFSEISSSSSSSLPSYYNHDHDHTHDHNHDYNHGYNHEYNHEYYHHT
mmetsp:Transcript_22112/g.61502  ORF Transcript_22112/g.61502 Transcript_22112/m.61502 type:complete len:283 (-) Transcript_22112:453-1301(-)